MDSNNSPHAVPRTVRKKTVEDEEPRQTDVLPQPVVKEDAVRTNPPIPEALTATLDHIIGQVSSLMSLLVRQLML